MTRPDAASAGAVWRAALLGIDDARDRRTYVSALRASPANAPLIRDEAVREYEHLHRSLESLDNKAGIALAGALALVTLAAASDGLAVIRWTVGVLAFLAGLLSGCSLGPSSVRGMGAKVIAEKYGTVNTAQLHLQVAAQCLDAVAATGLQVRVKALRVRIALTLLCLSAVLLALQ